MMIMNFNNFLINYFTGESAFHKMTTVGPWPKNPIGERMKMIDDELPITFIFGEGLYL